MEDHLGHPKIGQYITRGVIKEKKVKVIHFEACIYIFALNFHL